MTTGEIYFSTVYTFTQFGHWFIPNLDFKGCSYLSIHNNKTKVSIVDWILPSILTSGVDNQNIICIGLNKTGTTSFEKDLESIGYKFLPTSYGAIKLQTDVYHGDIYSTLSSLQNPNFNAYQDLPFSLPTIYEKIYDHRPNDIYILTVRSSVDLWVESVKKYYNWFIKDGDPISNNKTFEYFNGPEKMYISNFCAPTFHMWGIYSFSNLDNKLRDVYNKHYDQVQNFFHKKNQNNFMEIDVSKTGELKKLTNWLGIKNNKQNFSWENKSE